MKMSTKFLSFLLGSLTFALSISASAATYLGSWDLRGTGQKDVVYREGNALRIINAGGGQRDYNIGNSAWAVIGARNTNGAAGLEVVLRAGNDLVIVAHAIQSQRTYPVGNFSWSVLDITDVNKTAGDEVLINISTGIRILSDVNNSYRDVTFNSNNGSWALFTIADLAGKGPELVLNMGNGVKLIDPRTYGIRDFTLSGYTAVFDVAEVDGKLGLEVIGRTSGEVYVITGGVGNGSIKMYPGGGNTAWAIYGRTADTDGKAGDEIIVVLQNAIRIIKPATGAYKDYSIGSYNYTIDSVTNLDGAAGNEILVRDMGGQIFIINDRLGTIKRQ